LQPQSQFSDPSCTSRLRVSDRQGCEVFAEIARISGISASGHVSNLPEVTVVTGQSLEGAIAVGPWRRQAMSWREALVRAGEREDARVSGQTLVARGGPGRCRICCYAGRDPGDRCGHGQVDRREFQQRVFQCSELDWELGAICCLRAINRRVRGEPAANNLNTCTP
jgi:hypothetical protein